jgi:hypothetical protein
VTIIVPPAFPHRSPRWSTRLGAGLAAAALSVAVLTGCSGENVDCGLDACSVSLDRSANASASVLGVEAKFVSADGDRVTVEVAGEQLQLTVGQAATQVGGLQVSLESVTADAVNLRVAR